MAAAAVGEPLLTAADGEEGAAYHESCPGCKQDRKNRDNPGVPYKEFVYIWVINLCTALPISSLFPNLYFLIRDLGVAKRTEDIRFYAGFVGSAFMFGRTFTSIHWGVVADRYGRKPVIIISIASIIVFNTLFGLSTSYWMAISTRLFLGIFNGLVGPIKAYATEVCRKEHRALGMSLVTSSKAIGLVIGPALGGYLSHPVENFPNVFSKDSIFGRFPYFLPCLAITIFATAALISCYWLPETLHMHGNATVEASKVTCHGSDLEDQSKDTRGGPSSSSSIQSLFQNRALMACITIYCLFALHDTAYSEVFSLWAVSDKSYGGLSFSSQQVGTVLAISGVALLVFQLTLYPPIERALGALNSSQIAAAIGLPVLACYPFTTHLSGTVLTVVINCLSVVKNILSMIIFTGVNLIQNSIVPQNQRGAANGMTTTAISFFKSLAPASAGIVFSWAQKRQHASFLPGDQMVFFVLNMIMAIWFVLSFSRLLAQRSQKI